MKHDVRSFVRGLLAAAALIASALAVPSPAAGHAGFGDIGPATFYSEAVQWMVDNEITNGTSPTCFSPLDGVTRGQAAAFMWRMEGRPDAPPHSFTDVTKEWQNPAVSWMVAEGITTGTSPTTFSPEDVLTRGQLAALLWRLAGEPDAPPHPFTDVVKEWQQGAVSWLADRGITIGTSPTTFSPDDTVTRGQLATFFWRYKGTPAVELDPHTPFCGGPTDDEFDGAATDLLAGDQSPWQVRNGDAAELIEINSAGDGTLVISANDYETKGWDATTEGPFAYQTLSGDFAVAIRITLGNEDDPAAPPGLPYNSGGIVVRDDSQAHDWVMLGINGHTATHGLAKAATSTVDGESELDLKWTGERTYRLLVCRVGSEIRFFSGGPESSEWTADEVAHSRPDFGDELQVGVAASAWASEPQPWVEVERVHFGKPDNLDHCTTAVAPV